MPTTNKPLKDIANIISGYTFRKAIGPENVGYQLILQSKNIKNESIISDKDLTKISFKTTRTNSFAKNNDVVISSRGSFRSAVIKSTKKILASSSVYILHITDNQILPEFLSLYLNSSRGNKNLQNITTGSTIKSILKNDLESLKIPIPPFSTQKNLIKLSQNQINQAKLLGDKLTINSNILEGALYQL
ncbi:restriction endonuclease subunit S [Patescibacteria group bacterium]|nr:restriction endonuclease subunit S [Patescibacteria group bacterium]